ncbi:MAG: RNA pseudouridine synthase, partial [Pseudomonadota bacterium]
QMIFQGRVRLDHQILLDPACMVDGQNIVTLDGKILKQQFQQAKIWRYYKPSGLVVSECDEKGRKTIFDQLPKNLGRLISVGRLDLKSQGLLLLSNNGYLAGQLMSPKLGWERVYHVRVYGHIPDDAKALWQKGLNIEGERFGSISSEILSSSGRNTWIKMSLCEGRNREIRRAVEYFDCQVNRLIRVAFGPFDLGTLECGELQEVPQHMIKKLKF